MQNVMQVVYGILGILILALLGTICTSISSCAHYCSDAISDLKADNLGVYAEAETSPLCAEFGISAVSVQALQEKENLLTETINVLHARYRDQYSKEAKERFDRELIRKEAVKEEKSKLEAALKKIGREAGRTKEAQFKLRDFALRESPVLWETLQYFRAEIEYQDGEIEKIKMLSAENDVDIKTDDAYQRVVALRNLLVKNLRVIEDRLCDAYLLKLKVQATPSDRDLENDLKKIMDDGILEAEAAGKRYRDLKNWRNEK